MSTFRLMPLSNPVDKGISRELLRYIFGLCFDKVFFLLNERKVIFHHNIH